MPQYTLTPVVKVPTRLRTSVYREILTDFMQSTHPAEKVDVENRKPITVYQGLIKARKLMGADVRISHSNGEVYIQRLTA